jgi:hypothetical protein
MVRSSETFLTTYNITWRHNPKDHNRQKIVAVRGIIETAGLVLHIMALITNYILPQLHLIPLQALTYIAISLT